MSDRRVLATIALLLGVLGGLLVLLDFRLPRGSEDFLVWLGDTAVRAVLGLVALLASLLIFGRQYRAGGILNIVVGFVLLFLRASLAGSLLVLFSGILGLVASGTFDEYRYYRR